MEEVLFKIQKVWEERKKLELQLVELTEKYAKANEGLKIYKTESDRHRALWYEAKDEVENMKVMIAGYNMQITSMETELLLLRDKCQLYEDEKQHSLFSSTNRQISELKNEIIIRDAEIFKLHHEINSRGVNHKELPTPIDKNKIKEESQREILEKLIAYAEKLPKHRCLEATAIQGAISLLVSGRKISNNVLNDELGKRLENIAVEDNKALTTNIDTGGGPVIMGGKFDKTEFVTQKRIETNE